MSFSIILNGITGSAGDVNGIASLNVPVRCESLAQALACKPSEIAAALGLSGVLCVERPLGQHEDGGYEVVFQFQGFASPQTDIRDLELSFDGDMGEDPIETHPDFAILKAAYGYDDEKKEFPATLGGSGSGSSGSGSALDFAASARASGDSLSSRNAPFGGQGVNVFANSTATNAGNYASSTILSQSGSGGGGGDGEKANPLFGVTKWLKVGATFTRSYAVTTVSGSVYSRVGRLIGYPPDAQKIGVPKFTDRVWLVLAPVITQHGNARKVVERYRLSGITNGSEAIIYGSPQLR